VTRVKCRASEATGCCARLSLHFGADSVASVAARGHARGRRHEPARRRARASSDGRGDRAGRTRSPGVGGSAGSLRAAPMRRLAAVLDAIVPRTSPRDPVRPPRPSSGHWSPMSTLGNKVSSGDKLGMSPLSGWPTADCESSRPAPTIGASNACAFGELRGLSPDRQQEPADWRSIRSRPFAYGKR
jgi:hypothetical protein